MLTSCTVHNIKVEQIQTPEGEPYMWIMPSEVVFDPRPEQDI